MLSTQTMLIRSTLNLCFLCFAGLLYLTSGMVAIAPAQAQAPATAKSLQSTVQKIRKHVKFLDASCVWHRHQRGNIGYSICVMEDTIMSVSMDGPEGDNGPTAYFYGGKLVSFRDTGVGEAQLFDEQGRLLAEVEVGVVVPEYDNIKTKFTSAERKELTDRAIESSQHLLKVGGEWQRSRAAGAGKMTRVTNAQCKLSPGCEYGPEISDRWIKASQLVAKADFDGAITEYQKALEAATTAKVIGRNASRIKVMRACAINSSQAHLEGLKQAKDFRATHMMTAENYKMAVKIYRDRVKDVMAEQDAKFPELVEKCP